MTFFSYMLTRSKTPNWARKPREKIEIDSQSSVTREELEHLFAYELRVANADILKLKVYNRDDRYMPKTDLPEMTRDSRQRAPKYRSNSARVLAADICEDYYRYAVPWLDCTIICLVVCHAGMAVQ